MVNLAIYFFLVRIRAEPAPTWFCVHEFMCSWGARGSSVFGIVKGYLSKQSLLCIVYCVLCNVYCLLYICVLFILHSVFCIVYFVYRKFKNNQSLRIHRERNLSCSSRLKINHTCLIEDFIKAKVVSACSYWTNPSFAQISLISGYIKVIVNNNRTLLKNTVGNLASLISHKV